MIREAIAHAQALTCDFELTEACKAIRFEIVIEQLRAKGVSPQQIGAIRRQIKEAEQEQEINEYYY